MYAGLKTLVQAVVTSKLDFGNASLCGINGSVLNRLEMVQRPAARVIIIIIIIIVFSIATTHVWAYLDALHNNIYRYTIVDST